MEQRQLQSGRRPLLLITRPQYAGAYRKFKQPFFLIGYIASPGELSIVFWLMKISMLLLE